MTKTMRLQKTRRVELQRKLEAICNVKKVYFQPPDKIKLKYPCIIYSLDRPREFFGDNKRYIWRPQYTVMVIDPDPDSQIYLEILDSFDHASFNRWYTSDNLNHYILSLYY